MFFFLKQKIIHLPSFIIRSLDTCLQLRARKLFNLFEFLSRMNRSIFIISRFSQQRLRIIFFFLIKFRKKAICYMLKSIVFLRNHKKQHEKIKLLSILYINNSSRVSIYLQVLFFTKSLSAFRKIFHQFDWPTIFQRIDGEYVRQRSREPKLLSRHIQSVGNKKRRDRSPVNAANNWIAHSGYAQF